MSYLQNFRFEVQGADSNPKIVFLHGVMGTGSNWRRMTTGLKDQYQSLIFDQRGHGKSFKPQDGKYSPTDYANDLRLILDELGWKKIVLVGHSMGGRNALRFASLYPDRLRGLVIVDIGPSGNIDAMGRTLKILDLVPTPFPDRGSAKNFFAEDFPRLVDFHPQKAILGPFLLSNIEEKSDGTADWRFDREGIVASLKTGHLESRWQEVEALTMPTLWIRGEASDDLPEAEFTKILLSNPKIEGVVVARAGHWVHAEEPEAFFTVLKGFLDKL
jgi:esterase